MIRIERQGLDHAGPHTVSVLYPKSKGKPLKDLKDMT